MLGVSELTDMAIDAINSAVDGGILLIKGETGIAWDTQIGQWGPDRSLGAQVLCDVGGALLLAHQPLEFGDDVDRALRGLIAPEIKQDADLDDLLQSPIYEFIRNFFHGWDGIDYAGGHEEAYNAGFQLAKQYHPLDFQLLQASRVSAAR